MAPSQCHWALVWFPGSEYCHYPVLLIINMIMGYTVFDSGACVDKDLCQCCAPVSQADMPSCLVCTSTIPRHLRHVTLASTYPATQKPSTTSSALTFSTACSLNAHQALIQLTTHSYHVLGW